LYSKASKIEAIPFGKLATLEAIILRKHSKHKSDLPETTPLYEKDEEIGGMITAILEKYPQHKRVLYFKSKFDNNEIFSSADKTELQKFFRLLK